MIAREGDFLRQRPRKQLRVFRVLHVALIEVARKTVLVKYGCFPCVEFPHADTAASDFHAHVERQPIEIRFVSIVDHKIILGCVLFIDVVQTVDRIDALRHDLDADFIRRRMIAMLELRQTVKVGFRIAIEIERPIELDEIRALCTFEHFQRVRKTFHVCVLRILIFDVIILLPKPQDLPEIAALIDERAVRT